MVFGLSVKSCRIPLQVSITFDDAHYQMTNGSFLWTLHQRKRNDFSAYRFYEPSVIDCIESARLKYRFAAKIKFSGFSKTVPFSSHNNDGKYMGIVHLPGRGLINYCGNICLYTNLCLLNRVNPFQTKTHQIDGTNV